MRSLIKIFLSIFLLLIVGNAWATYPNYSFCPSGGGCDYTTFAGVVADILANHSTLSSPVTINGSGSWASSPDTSAVDFSGITTSATNTITISFSGSAVNTTRNIVLRVNLSTRGGRFLYHST